MPTSREVFAWPEAIMYLGPEGGLSALSYVEGVHITLTRTVQRDVNMASGTWAARTKFTITDQYVNVDIDKMWDGGLFAAIYSGTAYNFSLSAAGAADGNTASLAIWSGMFTRFTMDGQENGIFKASCSLIAADMSGV